MAISPIFIHIINEITLNFINKLDSTNDNIILFLNIEILLYTLYTSYLLFKIYKLAIILKNEWLTFRF